MLPVFLDWQNPCHVRQLHVILLLEKAPEEVQIILLDVLLLLRHAEHAVPLVNDEDKALPGLQEYFVQNVLEPWFPSEAWAFREAFLQFTDHRFFDFADEGAQVVP